MPNVAENFIKEAFIEPIRFALLIDDQFPVYSKIAEATPPIAQEGARAATLFNFCRGRGWLCDVDNAAKGENELDRVGHLNQSDLLVLDFHLDPTRAEDPTLSLQILQRLARSDHFNLVIVYTAANAIEVIRDVAFSLGAHQEIRNHEAASEFLENCDPKIFDSAMGSLNSAVLDNYLSGKSPGASAQAMRSIFDGYSTTTKGLHSDAIGLMCKQHMTSRVTQAIATNSSSKLKVQGSFEEVSEVFWVTSGNVFAVVVNKSEEPAVLVDRLIAGLIAWNPSALQVMMTHARAALEKTGRLTDHLVLDTPTRQAGWFLGILLGANQATRQDRIRELYERLFTRLIKSVSQSVVGFASNLIEPFDGNGHPMKAKQLASDATNIDDMVVYHALNEHLCSENYTSGAMTTGVVFRSTNDPIKYWLCTTPACDLVPGQNQSGWDKELHPLRQISTARLTPIKSTDSIKKLLATATQCRHIFLSVDGKPFAFEVVDPESRLMKLELMLLESEGTIVNAKFSGHILKVNADKTPKMDLTEFEVVALLRSDYANRLLAAVGQQRSRIGVDFVNQPTPAGSVSVS
jgi:CheY-like chemotaxis protein